jgi:hypothetical protein
MHRDKTMHYLKVLCGFGFLVVLVSNLWSISGWNEIRGVYDDLCYLRQAHLFQKSGLRGLDTNIALEDDHYLSSRLREIGFPTWRDPATAPCHTLIPTTKKLVIQYPPGTGFVLALFPEGSQVIALYVLTSLVAFGFALAAMVYASSLLSLALVAAFGDAALYLMINPTKASYSMAPTMMVCALAGFLTAKLFAGEGRRHRLVLTILIGLLLGLAVNFRLANLFLSAGYFAFLPRLIGDLTKNRGGFARFVVRNGIPDWNCSDAARECDQRGKSVRNHLWRCRCSAAGIEPRRALGVRRGRAIRIADHCGRMDRHDVAFERPERNKAARAGHRCKSCGEPDFLHDPPGFYSVLYDSHRDAFALDFAVRNLDSAPGSNSG